MNCNPITKYKDDELCHFCGEDLIYVNQNSWLCPNHNATILYKYVKANQSYSLQTRVIKDGMGIITSSNSIEGKFNTILVEFLKVNRAFDEYNKEFIKRIVGKKNISKLVWNDYHYYTDHYNVISSIPSIIKLNSNDLDECIKKFKNLIIFS